ncbi:MAG: putative bifunctional diguanylate cyclase/phosphodiesterase [Geminicoccales bacterium]
MRRLVAKTDLKGAYDDRAVLELIIQHANDGIVVQDVFGRIEWSNPAYSRISGFTADEIRGRRPQEFILPDNEKPSDEEIASFRYDISSGILNSYEIVRNVRKSGQEFWNQLSFAVVGTENDSALKVIVICRDVTEQIEREEALKKAKQEVEHLAWHDVLTGLANRAQLAAFLDRHLSQGQARVGLLHVDLDRFKAVNDTLGHAAGDAVLVHAGKMMQSLVRNDDLVSRVGGDEFVIACPNVEGEAALKATAERLVAELRAPFIWQDRSIHVGASVGISISRPGDCDAEELLHQADIALYQVKGGSRGSVMSFDAELGTIYHHRQQLHAALVTATKSDQLFVVFQPKQDLMSGQILGFEALVRWQHPEYGILPPASFFAIAEESGLMPEIDRIAARGALDGLSALHRAGWLDLQISLNVSSSLLRENDFVETLMREVETRHLEPDQVIVEILETTLFSREDDTTSGMIQHLSDAGFVIELDDFGTGYAGLAHLARLPIHGVKIDRSMIQRLPNDPTSQAIVRAIIELCHELGLQTVAEGVECDEQQAFLSQSGCSMAQGYGIAPPMPLADTLAWMAKVEQNPSVLALHPREPLDVSPIH